MKSIRIAFALLMFSFPAVSSAQETQALMPFVTDGCTGFIDGTRKTPDAWRYCCVEHDFLCWVGGTPEERKAADQNLRSCVRDAGYPGYARIIYAGVRLGAVSPLKIKSKQWGNSRPWDDHYSARPANAIPEMLEVLNSLDIPESRKQSIRESL